MIAGYICICNLLNLQLTSLFKKKHIKSHYSVIADQKNPGANSRRSNGKKRGAKVA